MKKRKLKSFVIPTLYIMTLSVIFISMMFLGTSLAPVEEDDSPQLDYSVDSLQDDEVPVVSEVEEKSVKPYTDESVTISKDYYSKDDETDGQTNSLIYYENTYMQNTGILYTSENTFDVVSVLDGTIKNITTDEILGAVIEITHTNNLTSYYYSLSEVTVNIGDTVTTGQVIGKSGNNKIENNAGSSLLFEIYYEGKTIDPNTFYESELKTFE